jgi:hypothetical protein
VALQQSYGDEGPVRGGAGVKVTDLGSDHRLIEHGVEQLAHGAMICPECSKPVPIGRRIPVSEPLTCGWCAGSGPARDYLVRDVYDTSANEVFLIARIG